MNSKKPYGIIYLLTSPSGKQYVGQTVQPLKARLKGHESDAKRDRNTHLPLCRSILKYGISSFKHKIIAKAKDREDLDNLERYYISILNTCQEGLNVDEGGRGRSGFKLNEKQKEALRKTNSKPKTKEHRENMSKSHTGMKKPWVIERNKKGLSVTSKEKISKTLIKFNEERKKKEIFPHGETRGYWRGCKCKDCKKAAAFYSLERKRNKKQGE